MKILVLGYGYIGSVVARDLAESILSVEVVIAGRNRKRAEEVAIKTGRNNVTSVQLNASNRDALADALKGFDLVVGALPGNVGYQSVKTCIEVAVNAVDVSFMPEDPLTLSEDAIEAGVTIIPDCGVAPGLSNILVAHAMRKLDKVRDIQIMVGGLPEKPVPPLGYTITWSVEGLIDEYTRKARIVKNGKVIEVEALSGLEDVDLPGVGRLEAFYTDGLRTLLHTVKGVPNMCEKTLRYSGHVEKIKLLKTLGFFDEKPMLVENVNISPRQITARLLEQKLMRPDVPDITAMRVRVDGDKDGRRIVHSYYMLDRYDKKDNITSMARTTGYTASCVTQLLAKKAIKEEGVITPEKLGADETFYKKLTGMLEDRGIQIEESQKTSW